ncbi:hypothetical protein DCAR_0312953 [Daucus carota subsp. sativus]|uniref:Uncharacterized protein n=1 Tax=Daucus carota subsp. sativus TaxID=79200 RepID=A0AAF0WPC3_DAUCS|nr:hypothetical protein DCAR_0312953 [Daucus carota subsp. sativus]
MAAPNSQLPAVSGNPNIVPKKEDEEEQDAFAIERERLARECKAIEEKYLKEEAVRFKKYEADMRQELIETYFSDKDIFGDKIFEETGIDGIKAARYAGTESYADPIAYLQKKEAFAKSAANTSTDILLQNLS